MAKNKNQKRKKKLEIRQKRRDYSQLVDSIVNINEVKIRQAFPDKQKRLEYIHNLIGALE
mgnify:CR=1 FL=1